MSDNPFRLGGIQVTAWGKEEAGKNNDCWWNIARNQLVQGGNANPSASQINELMKEIIAYNNDIQGLNLTKDSVLETGQQIFIPLEQGMDEIKASMKTATDQMTTLQGEIGPLQQDASAKTTDVATKLKALNDARGKLNASDDEDGSAKTAYDQALAEYQQAVKDQQEANRLLQEKQEEIDELNETLKQYATDLAEMQSDYEEEEGKQNTELAGIQGEIEALQGKASEAQTQLDTAKADAERNAQAAKDMGAMDENGEAKNPADVGVIDQGKLDTAIKGNAQMIDGKVIKNEEISEDKSTKTVTLDDGTTQTMKLNESTGQYELQTDSGSDSGSDSDSDEGEEPSEEQMRSDLAEARAQTLYAAMNGAGTNEEAVRDILKGVGGQDLVDVMKVYEEKYGTSLEDAVRGDFSFISGEGELVGYLNSAKMYAKDHEREAVDQNAILDARVKAFDTATTDKAGTNEEVLNDMIQNMTDKELAEFAQYYEQTKGVSLKSVIESETSFEQQNMLTRRLDNVQANAGKDEAKETPGEELTEEQKEAKMRNGMAEARAAQLHAAMDRAGTDEDAVREILQSVGGQDLVDVMKVYEEKYGTSLEDAIRGDFSFISGEGELVGYLNSASMYAKDHERETVTEEAVNNARAKAFIEATTGRAGTDENIVYDMLQNGQLTDNEIVALANTLRGQGVDIVDVIESEFSGSVEKALVARLESLGIKKNENNG